MMYHLLLTQLFLLIWVRPQEGAIVITKPPQNQTVCEGDNVTITCGFDGSNDIIPNWIINNRTFGNNAITADDMLYAPNVNNTNDTVLIMLSVTASMNGTRTQCELQTRNPVYSSIAVLTITGPPLTLNIIVTEVALDSFTVSWDVFSHDACGGVVHTVRLSKGIQIIVENMTTMNTISYSGLNDTTLYGVSVFATNRAGPGSAMNVNVTTLTPAVPSPPRQLKVNTLFINYEPIVWITWTSPLLTPNMTEVESYNVTLYDKDQRLYFTISRSQAVFNLSEEDIKLNIRETYTINVSAINSVGYGPVAMTTFKLQWLQSAMISLSPDNKTVTVTCEVSKASPQVECSVTINCTKCIDGRHNTKSFRGSTELAVTPADLEYYVITVQAIRADNSEPLEDYFITRTLQIPKTKPSNTSNTSLADDSDDDPAIWIYIVIAIAVLVVIVIGILLISIIYCYVVKKRRVQSIIGYDEEKKKGGMIGYARHSDSSTPRSSVTEKYQTDHHMHMENGLYNGKIDISSEKTVNNLNKDVTTSQPSKPSDSPASIIQDSYSQVDLIKENGNGLHNGKNKDVTSSLPSDPSDSPASIKQDSYSQVDLIKKHDKTNYVELGPFDTKKPTLMPMGAPQVKYTEVKIQYNQNKQENSS